MAIHPQLRSVIQAIAVCESIVRHKRIVLHPSDAREIESNESHMLSLAAKEQIWMIRGLEDDPRQTSEVYLVPFSSQIASTQS